MKMRKTMEYKGFNAQIMEAERLIGDHVFGLPQGKALQVYYADEFLHPPENWMKGQGVFIVPVRPNKGLWFNWRGNDEFNTAILPTVKGCNPITGLQTSGFHMEKYENKCPKHGCDFMADRFCPECDFKWANRNYCSMNPLWWDGFRAEDGAVRQFFFSEEELRDVASHMIGKKNTVPAFGFTFFTPKERRKNPSDGDGRGMSGSIFTLTSSFSPGITGIMGSKGLMSDSFVTSNSGDVNLYHSYENKEVFSNDLAQNDKPEDIKGGPIYACASSLGGEATIEPEDISDGGIISPLSLQERLSSHKSMKKRKFAGESKKKSFRKMGEPRGQQVNSTPRPKQVKEVSIGAGARIRQDLNPDPYSLDSWKEIPDASMTIYFVFQEKFEELKAKGMRDISGAKEGMLQNVPVG